MVTKRSKCQADVLNKYNRLGYKTLVSCEFDMITGVIDGYCSDFSTVKCKHCRGLRFLNKELLKLHVQEFHKIVD